VKQAIALIILAVGVPCVMWFERLSLVLIGLGFIVHMLLIWYCLLVIFTFLSWSLKNIVAAAPTSFILLLAA